jgi:hypothetical protein
MLRERRLLFSSTSFGNQADRRDAAVFLENESGWDHQGETAMSITCADAFQRIVEEEQAAIRAEEEEKRMMKEAAQKRLKEARRAAQGIRDHVIFPMLSRLRETFMQGKVPPQWEVKPAEEHDEFAVLLTALHDAVPAGKSLVDWDNKPGSEHEEFSAANSTWSRGGLRKKFSVKAAISVIDGGPSLGMSVVLPKALGGNDAVVINTRDIVELHDGQCDEPGVALWYQTQMEECARRCVRLAAEEEKP